MDGTPIYDIKPYLPYGDCHPDASGGFAGVGGGALLEVACPEALLTRIPPDKREALLGVLARDPRPPYQNGTDRVYGMAFGEWEVKFSVRDKCLTVLSLSPRAAKE